MTAEAYEIGGDRQARQAGDRRGRRPRSIRPNINQMQGRSLEVMAPAINRYLTEQQRAAARAGADHGAAQGRP